MEIDKIKNAQIIAGENAVIARVRAKGLAKDEQSKESLLFFSLFREVRNEIATEEGYVLQDAVRITFDKFKKKDIIVENILVNVYQLILGWKNTTPLNEWSDWDEKTLSDLGELISQRTN